MIIAPDDSVSEEMIEIVLTNALPLCQMMRDLISMLLDVILLARIDLTIVVKIVILHLLISDVETLAQADSSSHKEVIKTFVMTVINVTIVISADNLSVEAEEVEATLLSVLITLHK